MFRGCLPVLACLLPVLSLSSCLSPEYDHYSLHAKVRGLAADETITISNNGTATQLSGTQDLSWSEAQKIRNTPRSDEPDYRIRIVRQPQNSNKACRVLNPTGRASYANTQIRIECGFPLLIQDEDGNMTTDNGLMVSNGFERIALNASRQLVTSLRHDVITDPSDPTIQSLQLTPQITMGAALFNELYLPGESIQLNFSSINQGCEITSNPLVGGLYPSSDAFTNTVQTIDLASDWIRAKDTYADGRVCSSFSAGTTYVLTYDPQENKTGNTTYTATCFPAPAIEIACAFALKLRVKGLNASEGDVLIVNAENITTGSTHQIRFETNRTETFNLIVRNGDAYEITLDPDTDPGTWTTPKTCDFEPNGLSIPTPSPNPSVNYVNAGGNTLEVLTCSE